MKKKLISVVLLLCIALFAFADSVNIYGVNSWSRVDSHTIILYSSGRAVALVKVNFAFINSTSNIRFLSDYISSYDKVIIDGQAYDISSVSRL